MPKTTPETAAYIERAARLREEARAAFESRRDSSRSFSPEAERAWLDKLRRGFTAGAGRGDLPIQPTAELAWAFSDEKLRELLLVDAEGKARKAAAAERRATQSEIKSLANRIERERAQAAREDAEAEAAKRLAG